MEVLVVSILVAAVLTLILTRNRTGDDSGPPPRSRPKPSYRRPAPNQPPRFEAQSATQSPTGRVICGPARIVDGDTLVVRKTQIRLFGVDAPEIEHPYGQKAKWALIGLCKGQQVRAEILETDVHGRTVARCNLPDGRDLSAEMVKLGMAIDWKKFSGGIYRALELPDARKKLWLADARQKGRMHVWEAYEPKKKAKK